MNLKSVFFLATVFTGLTIVHACGGSDSGERPDPRPEPEYRTPVPLADPFILCHQGKYYAYGTNADDGIRFYTSDDLTTWKPGGLALNKKDVYADRWFWAPEVYYVASKNKFYMYYSADEHICVATSASPEGPFTQEVKAPMRDEKGIDNTLFIDDDGKAYLYFVRFTDGNCIWVAELEDDLRTLKEQTLTYCLSATQPWESMMGRVAEGPFVIKRNGTYFLTYSANDYQSPDYAVGFATSDSPMGPWTKYEGNPILRRPGILVGTGHHSLFTDKDGKLRIVFHSHYDSSNVQPRIMHVGNVGFSTDGGAGMMRVSDIFTPYIEL